MNERLKLIERYLKHFPQANDALKKLAEMGWDYEGEPFVLKEELVKNIFERYLKAEISAEDVHRWAEFIEGRDDIDYKKFEEIVFSLANPEINGALTKERAEEWLTGL